MPRSVPFLPTGDRTEGERKGKRDTPGPQAFFPLTRPSPPLPPSTPATLAFTMVPEPAAGPCPRAFALAGHANPTSSALSPQPPASSELSGSLFHELLLTTGLFAGCSHHRKHLLPQRGGPARHIPAGHLLGGLPSPGIDHHGCLAWCLAHQLPGSREARVGAARVPSTWNGW